MKFTKTLAAIAAASLAVSSLAVSAFAAWDGATGDNLIIDMAKILPEGVDISEVYGVKVTFTDEAADVVAKGAGGGFIFSTKSNNWNQLQWCNGCEDPEKHEIQWDADTKSITRMEEKPFFTAEDISGADGTYGQLALSEWWGGDIAYSKIEVLDKDGKVLPVADEPADTDTKPAEPKPIQTKAEIAAVNSKEPSYIYTVKGDIDTLKVDVAVSPNEEDKSFEWNDWCGAGVIVKNPDGTTKYYQWGGAQVSWGWDATGDKEPDSIDGVKGETWVGTVSAEDRSGQLSIPVVKGSVVEFYCLSWVDDATGEAKYTKTQYTLTINDEEVAADDNKTPDDDTKNDDKKNDDTNKEDPAKPGESSGVVNGDSTKPAEPGETEVPVEPGKSDKKPADDNKKPANPDAGVAVAVVPTALAAAAVAAAGIVLKKRSK